MTSKEKAVELVEKYYKITDVNFGIRHQKKCSLIAVDEIIKQQKEQNESMHWSCVTYWEEVKQEIEML